MKYEIVRAKESLSGNTYFDLIDSKNLLAREMHSSIILCNFSMLLCAR